MTRKREKEFDNFLKRRGAGLEGVRDKTRGKIKTSLRKKIKTGIYHITKILFRF